jgi:hypothetical protein
MDIDKLKELFKTCAFTINDGQLHTAYGISSANVVYINVPSGDSYELDLETSKVSSKFKDAIEVFDDVYECNVTLRFYNLTPVKINN